MSDMKRIIAGVLCCLLMISTCYVSFAEEGLSDATKELMKLNIIHADKNGNIRENECLTTIECLEVFSRLSGSYYNTENIEERWKNNYPKKIKTDPPLWQKEIICNLPAYLVLEDEWDALNLNACCKQKDAILYCVRAVTDIGGCIRSADFYEYTPQQVYDTAYAKGLISSNNMDHSNDYITRREFFSMIDKLLFVEFQVGGDGGGSTRRYIDNFKKDEDTVPVPTYEERIQSFLNNNPAASEAEYNKSLSSNSSMNRWVNYGILEGFPNKELDRQITRGEFAVVISRVLGYTYVGGDQFQDLNGTAWYADDFLRAFYARVIKGCDGYAYPDNTITREEAMVMLSRAFYIEKGATDDIKFVDASEISPWAKESVCAMVSKGYIKGDETGSFNPQSFITYSELSEILNRIVNVYYNLPRTYGTDATTEIKGNVVIASPNVVLKNTTIEGNLYLAPNIYNGNLVLNNVKVNGTVYLWGMSGDPICFVDCSAKHVTWVREDWSSYPVLQHSGKNAYAIDVGKDPIIHDDMSISWTLPDNMFGVDGYSITFVDADGNEIKYGTSLVPNFNTLKGLDILKYISKYYPKKINSIRVYPVSLSKDVDTSHFLNIDISEIHAKEEGNPLTLQDIYVEEPHKVFLTLGNNDNFEEGNYYCVSQYDGQETRTYIFQADATGQTCSIDNLFGYLGGGTLKHLKIQKVTVSGDAKTGFEITYTLMPEKPFTVISTD